MNLIVLIANCKKRTMLAVWRAAEKLRWLRATSRQFGHRILHLFVTVEHQTRKIHNTGMQIQIQILIQLQYLPSWVPWRGNCLPPFPHNALPSIPRAEISQPTILVFHGVHFFICVFFYLKHLFVYLHLYLSRTFGRVSPWVRLRLRQFLNFQPRYTPLPLSTADISRFIHQVWGFLDFALWISRPTDNRGEGNYNIRGISR